MQEAAENALASFRHHQALSIVHARNAETYLEQFLSVLNQETDLDGVAPAQSVRCVREWTSWLADNGPAYKSTIAEATGVKFTERGTPYTFQWVPSYAGSPDDAFPANALMKIDGPSSGSRGRPKAIYFLWSQRWDVLPKFGVGPVKPAEGGILAPSMVMVGEPPAPLYGNVTIALPETTDDGLDWDTVSDTDSAVPFETMEAWDAEWASVFDDLARSETKPSDDVRTAMVNSLPPGAEPNAAIAIAMRQAVQRVS